ncbi:MAG: EamA family transporter [Flavobacteriales bacterium]|nr:EamA family transporter [Flavobacteriales bacterium]
MINFSAIILKIISSTFYLFSGIVWKKVIRRNINYRVIYYRSIFSIVSTLLAILTFQKFSIVDYSIQDFKNGNIFDWLFTISLCFFSFFGLYYYTNALKIGRYGFVTPFVSTASIFSFLTALLFFNEEASIYNLSSFGLLTVGILYHQKQQLKDFKLNKEILLSILCAFFWGVSFVLYLIPIKKFGVLNFSLILEVCVFISAMGILIIREKKIVPSLLSKRSMKLSMLIGLLVTGGNITAHYALDNMPIIINIVVALIFEAIMLVVGIKIFKEKFLIKDWVLIIIITLATTFVLF